MKLNYALLAIAVTLGAYGVLHAEQYPPTYACVSYYYACNMEGPCAEQSGQCSALGTGQQVPYTAFTAYDYPVGMCLEYNNTTGCSTGTVQSCILIYNDVDWQNGEECTVNNRVCGSTWTADGC